MALQPSSSVDGMPHPLHNHLERGYSSGSKTPFMSSGSGVADLGSTLGKPPDSSPLSQTAAQQQSQFNEEWDASQRGSSIAEGPGAMRANSAASQGETLIPLRGGTLKKKASLRRGNSLKRSGSRRSSKAGSVRSLALEAEGDEMRSAFYSPVPTTGNPTDILADRFSVWRKVLKDLITYFREIQSQYEQRSKTLLKVSNVINNTTAPPMFLASGGISDALQILKDYHKQSIVECNKARAIENDVILALTGLRSDLQQKIKEIKNLSGDFKNSVDKELEGTRRAVQNLGDALGQADVDPAQMTGKQDPYLLRLAADRQLERQIDEENYLHQAYLNLESSGRELEAIVVGEIQKSYNAYAGIVKREADESYNTVESLRMGPIVMPKDKEWNVFVEKDERFVDPRIPVRQVQNIYYPGRDHELAAEVRAGLLERKSKYLKSYTAGWYVLSPTHLHEFKSADKTQAPIMSLYLPEQKLGSHSTEGGSSNKFMLKGRQTGSMHRGHSWVFRAESHDTMMAWYEDIRNLTEKSPQERSAFVRQHARSFSGNSQRAASISSDGALDEEDEEPFSTAASDVVTQGPKQDVLTKRPQPGGRFPSDLQVDTQRGLQVPLSPSSGSSLGDDYKKDRDVVAAATGLPGSGIGQHYEHPISYGMNSAAITGINDMRPTHASHLNQYAQEDGMNPYTASPIQNSEIIHDQQATSAPEVVTNYDLQHGAEVAALEATTISAPDANHTGLNVPLAAQEPATIASPGSDPVLDRKMPQDSQVFRADSKVESPTYQAPDTSFEANSNHTLPQSTQSNEFSAPFKIGVDTTAVANSRPTLADVLRAGQHHESVSSISQLHVPGEFPGGDVNGKEYA